MDWPDGERSHGFGEHYMGFLRVLHRQVRLNVELRKPGDIRYSPVRDISPRSRSLSEQNQSRSIELE